MEKRRLRGDTQLNTRQDATAAAELRENKNKLRKKGKRWRRGVCVAIPNSTLDRMLLLLLSHGGQESYIHTYIHAYIQIMNT